MSCQGGGLNALGRTGFTKLKKQNKTQSSIPIFSVYDQVFLLGCSFWKGLLSLPVDWKLCDVWAGLAGEPAVHSDEVGAVPEVFFHCSLLKGNENVPQAKGMLAFQVVVIHLVWISSLPPTPTFSSPSTSPLLHCATQCKTCPALRGRCCWGVSDPCEV